MGLVENAGAVSNALFYAADSDDMLLVVGAGTGCEFRSTAEDGFDAIADCGDEFAVFIGVDGVDDHKVFDVVFEIGILRL